MLARLRRHLSLANVCSVTALFVALGTGAAYAANTIGSDDIIDESIQSVDIKNDQVKTQDVLDETITTDDIGPAAVGKSELADGSVDGTKLADGSVGGAKVAGDAVDGSKVADGSLTTADLKGADVVVSLVIGKGSVKPGTCKTLNVAAAGAGTGEAVAVGAQAALPRGILIEGVGVPSAGTVTLKVCDLQKKKMPAVAGIPVRILTFG